LNLSNLHFLKNRSFRLNPLPLCFHSSRLSPMYLSNRSNPLNLHCLKTRSFRLNPLLLCFHSNRLSPMYP
jgi:hypothetical protein